MDFSKYAINILADFKPGDAPIRPEAAALSAATAEWEGGGEESLSTWVNHLHESDPGYL